MRKQEWEVHHEKNPPFIPGTGVPGVPGGRPGAALSFQYCDGPAVYRILKPAERTGSTAADLRDQQPVYSTFGGLRECLPGTDKGWFRGPLYDRYDYGGNAARHVCVAVSGIQGNIRTCADQRLRCRRKAALYDGYDDARGSSSGLLGTFEKSFREKTDDLVPDRPISEPDGQPCADAGRLSNRKFRRSQNRISGTGLHKGEFRQHFQRFLFPDRYHFTSGRAPASHLLLQTRLRC